MWKDVDLDLRLDLSLREFKEVCGEYREVIIVPIVQGNRFRGCVAVDTKFQAPADVLYRITLQVSDIAGEAAVTMGTCLALLSRWTYTHG